MSFSALEEGVMVETEDVRQSQRDQYQDARREEVPKFTSALQGRTV